MLIYSYINTRGDWKNSKLCENTPPFGRRVSTQFLIFPISTRVDITVYQHGKCFIFLKYKLDTGTCISVPATSVPHLRQESQTVFPLPPPPYFQ